MNPAQWFFVIALAQLIRYYVEHTGPLAHLVERIHGMDEVRCGFGEPVLTGAASQDLLRDFTYGSG